MRSTARGEKIRKWAKRLLLGLLALVLLLAGAGAGYEAFGRWSDARRFRPPGRLVDVGGRRIHLDCTGSGSPTVVLEAGLGLPALLWRDVQPGIASFANVCSYDRAGYGYSDAGPMPRTLDRRVDDLRAALSAGGHAPPYVLVAHSAGGFLARGFRHRFPGEVAGVVLVDSSHEEQFTRGPASMAAEFRKGLEMDGPLAALAPLGLPRLLVGMQVREYVSSGALADEFVALTVRTPAMEASRSEAESVLRGGDVPAGATLGDLPLVVLTAGRAESWGLPAGDAAAMRKLWVDELQPELARLSTRGRRGIVDGSGHLIPIEKPQAVVEAVREVVEAARSP
jgi:pimeloyl-ACP methyl ester carboxylesterase